MNLSRREFVMGLGGCALGLGVSGLLQQQSLLSSASSGSYRDYTIYTQGREGARHPHANPALSTQSVVLAIDLKTGQYRSNMVPIYSAHHVLFAEPNERLFVISQKGPASAVVDPNLQTEHILQAPNGLHFSGHGAITPDQDHLLLTYRRVSDDSKEHNHGVAGIYNVRNYKLEELVDIGGFGPHDVMYLSDQKTVALSCTGNLRYFPDEPEEKAGDTPDYSVEDPNYFAPKVVLFDMEQFKPVDEIISPVRNPVVHLTVSDEDKVYSVSNRYIPKTKRIRPEALQRVADVYSKREWPLHFMEKAEGIVMPLPIIEYDVRTKQTRTIYTDDASQRRSQSITFNRETGHIFASFVFSNTLVRISKDGEPEVFDSKAVGITDPIGVCEIPGTPYISVAGVYDNMSIVDARSMELVQSLPGHLFRSSHLTAVKI